MFFLTVIWARSTKPRGMDASRSGCEAVLNVWKEDECINEQSAVSLWQKSMKVFLMTVTYLILPPASLPQSDHHKTVLTCTECWEALKPILHFAMTNGKEQLDEFSSSVVWLLQRNCISETWQAETKKLLPLAVDLWSGSDWCCMFLKSWRNEWWN